MIDFKKKIEEEMQAQEGFELEEELKPRKKSWVFKLTGFFIAFFILFSATVLISSDNSGTWISKIPFLSKLGSLVESADKKLKGEDQDRINFLLLGMGGSKHEGGFLTDTIIFVSFKPSTKEVAMMSIPRDLSISVEGMGWQKVNAVNAFAELKKPGSGGAAISQAIGDILNVPIHYYFRVDFDGFVNAVDILGGLDIEVENTLSDYRYPIAGRESNEDYYSRFEHLYIEKGMHHMDGTLALKYARSRHALGVEGSDFARARRQQKIIEATKSKLLKTENLFKPSVLSDLISELNNNIDFNFTIYEGLKLWQMVKDVESSDIQNYVLDDGPNGLLVASRNNIGSYVLYPRGGDYTEIRYLIQDFFPEKITAIEEGVEEASYTAKLEIKNGTWINGLANQVSMKLSKKDFEVLGVSNSSKRDFQRTVIYDLTYGKKKADLNYLRDFLDADVYFELPLWLVEDIKDDLGDKEGLIPDFLIILGEDATRIGL